MLYDVFKEWFWAPMGTPVPAELKGLNMWGNLKAWGKRQSARVSVLTVLVVGLVAGWFGHLWLQEPYRYIKAGGNTVLRIDKRTGETWHWDQDRYGGSWRSEH